MFLPGKHTCALSLSVQDIAFWIPNTEYYVLKISIAAAYGTELKVRPWRRHF